MAVMKIEEITKSNIALENPKKIVLNILYANILINENFNEIFKKYDLSSEQYNVLRILRGQEKKSASMGIIQERMIARSSNTTRLVDKLLDKGLVIREVNALNRRKIEVTITLKGLNVLNEITPEIDNYENKFAQNLSTKELDDLNDLLEKYRTILQPNYE